MNDAADFYKIASEIGECAEGETADLGWCKVGDNTKDSQVHGAAPWARMLDFTNQTTHQPNDLVTHGFKNAALAPDPDHCLMAIIKNVSAPDESLCKARNHLSLNRLVLWDRFSTSLSR